MPLPEQTPPLVQAPAWAGVGLIFTYHWRFARPWWPSDWWQRNYDAEWDNPGPLPLTERQMRIPNFPYPA